MHTPEIGGAGDPNPNTKNPPSFALEHLPPSSERCHAELKTPRSGRLNSWGPLISQNVAPHPLHVEFKFKLGSYSGTPAALRGFPPPGSESTAPSREGGGRPSGEAAPSASGIYPPQVSDNSLAAIAQSCISAAGCAGGGGTVRPRPASSCPPCTGSPAASHGPDTPKPQLS